MTLFKDKLVDALSKSSVTHLELADQFEVAQSTVKRWLHGVARPHPFLQEMILEFINESVKKG